MGDAGGEFGGNDNRGVGSCRFRDPWGGSSFGTANALSNASSVDIRFPANALSNESPRPSDSAGAAGPEDVCALVPNVSSKDMLLFGADIAGGEATAESVAP